jgi:hypothetical protein
LNLLYGRIGKSTITISAYGNRFEKLCAIVMNAFVSGCNVSLRHGALSVRVETQNDTRKGKRNRQNTEQGMPGVLAALTAPPKEGSGRFNDLSRMSTRIYRHISIREVTIPDSTFQISFSCWRADIDAVVGVEPRVFVVACVTVSE